MPNWIINRICAKGETAQLKKFFKAIEGKNRPVDFDRIWYCENHGEIEDDWGTGAESEIVVDRTTMVFGFVVIQFETPWSPPGPSLLLRLKRQFPDITFMFHAYDFDAHAEEIMYDGRDVDELEMSLFRTI